MAAVAVQIRGTLYDLQAKTSRQVVLMGEASLLGLEIGGGPVYPPEGGNGGGKPPSIWDPAFPTPPIPIYPGGTPNPPNIWGPNDPRPQPPIYLPPEQTPPELKPPEAPAPGSPTTVVPGNYAVQPVTPPAYLTVNWPGIGPCTVAQPLTAQPKPQ